MTIMREGERVQTKVKCCRVSCVTKPRRIDKVASCVLGPNLVFCDFLFLWFPLSSFNISVLTYHDCYTSYHDC